MNEAELLRIFPSILSKHLLKDPSAYTKYITNTFKPCSKTSNIISEALYHQQQQNPLTESEHYIHFHSFLISSPPLYIKGETVLLVENGLLNHALIGSYI